MKKYFYAKIRSDLKQDVMLYAMNDGSNSDIVNHTMIKHAGEVHRFYLSSFGTYRSNEIDYNWTDEMFEYKIGVKYA